MLTVPKRQGITIPEPRSLAHAKEDNEPSPLKVLLDVSSMIASTNLSFLQLFVGSY
jgi:hypothetical protein